MEQRCAICRAEEFIPYVCRYCGRVHCVYHRLPENHDCPNIQQARAPKPVIRVERRPTGANLRVIRVPRISSISSRELYALIGALLVLGLSFLMKYMFIGLKPVEILEIFPLILLVIGTGFLGHELAHKFTAQRYGCWAEFKLWTVGAIMALLFAAISLGNVIFAAPGAVYIASRSSYFGETIDRRANGIISLVGPLVNVAGAAIFGSVLVVSTGVGYGNLVIGNTFRFLQVGVQINLLLGAFNMIPYFILDGQKVFAWDKRVWTAVAIPLWIAAVLSIRLF